MLRGYCYFTKGEYKRAISDVDQTLRLQPDYPNAIVLRDEAKQYLARGGMLDRAGQCARQCVMTKYSCESDNDLATMGGFAMGGFNLKGAMLGGMIRQDCRSQQACVQSCMARR